MKKYLGRYILLGAIVAVLFSALIAQLVNLQIIQGADNTRKAYSKRTKTITSRGDRGTITDANSLTMASDKKIYNIQFYRDPTWKPNPDENGIVPSALGTYTQSIIDAIDIVERYGGTIEATFSIVWDEAREEWAFEFGDISESAKQAREEMWRSNFYMQNTETYPMQELVGKLCETYKIPKDLPDEKILQVLAVWETMQMNAFLSRPITIASDVSWETVVEMETRSLLLSGISVSVSTKRVYPNNTLASHVLGYVGRIQSYETYYASYADKGYNLSDTIGLDGVEKTMEDWLTANTSERQGKEVVEINRYGSINRTLSVTQPQNGNNVKLTLDSGLQRVVEEALRTNIGEIREKQEALVQTSSWLNANKEDLQGSARDFEANPIKFAEKGAVVVVDMKGRVLALASHPTFDPNAFIVGGDAAAEILLDERNPLVNYAIGSRDTPGSIFKMVTGTAALATGQLGPYELISDDGKFDKYDKTNPPKCWISNARRFQHANQTIIQGLSNSCNYFFYTCASRMFENTDEQLYKYSALYGLTTLTGIELPGELRSYVGSQSTLYDPQKAISAAEQSTWKPSLVFASIKAHLVSVGKNYDIVYDDTKLNTAVKRLMDMAIDSPQSTWVREIRTILMEELDMSQEIAYMAKTVGDVYIALNEIKWGGSESIMTGIGQSITAVTPVAVARYIAAVANGGTVYDLTLVDSITSPEGEILSKSTPVVASELDEAAVYLPFIHEGMHKVVDEGGTAGKKFEDWSEEQINNIAAKTGTAERTTIDVENNAWMVAFAPYENPEIAIVAYIPNGYSGGDAATVIREVIEYWMDQKEMSSEDLMPAPASLAY